MAVPFPLQDSCYTQVIDKFVRKENCTYSMGLDYVWHHAENGIGFVNSMKMKMSIIVGVIHMLFGISLKGLNALHFSDYTSFFLEFIPQFVFMTSTFGYMVLCIIIKWLQDFSLSPGNAPSIISLFINLISEVDTPLIYDKETQLYLQQTLVIISFLCVPIMLLGKPIMTALKNKPL